MTHLLDYLADRVLLADGPVGTQVQARDLDTERDFHGHENCTDILCESRPDLVREIHLAYLRAGCDAVQTNSFGSSPITLGEFGIAEKAFELNRRAGELAREAVAEFAHDGRTRFVFGSVGPGTRLPSLGHIAYQDLEDALTVQCAGLVAGGVDAIVIETCQDPLQIKAAVNGAKRAREAAGKDIPIIVRVTVETTGTLLVGADIAAAATIIHALDVPIIGLNCATGPREMAEHVKWLGDNWPGPISIQPNAGLPELIGGHTHYPLTPKEMAQWLAKHKAAEALKLQEAAGRLVITADTTVLLHGEILGKPRDKAHARQLLLSLRGRWHHVITGIAVSRKIEGQHRIEATSCITPVLMRNYSLAEIDAYIASGDPMDKAGAYGIQHPAFQPTEYIDGCYLNVVGLPLCVLVDLLADFKVYPVIAGQRQDDQEMACPWSKKCSI